MKRNIALILCIIIGLPAILSAKEASKPMVAIITSMGTIKVELYPDQSPQTVSNFLKYVRSGFYKDTIFHRVIPGFMIQGGGLTKDMKKKQTAKPIINEAFNGLKNLRGTIAMARTSFPHSATSQFFINVVDNPFLDFKGRSKTDWGYCVFGKIVDGMNVVDSIAEVPTSSIKGRKNVPIEPVIIKDIQLLTTN